MDGERKQHRQSEDGEHPQEPDPKEEDDKDPVDEAVEESFPASDPPAW